MAATLTEAEKKELFDATDGNFAYRYVEAYEHQIAHAKLADRSGRYARNAALLAGFLGIFTGVVWTGTIAGAGVLSGSTIKIVAAVAAFLGAATAVFSATYKWTDEQKYHAAAETAWEAVKRDLGQASKSPTNAQVLELLKNDETAARNAEKLASPGDLEEAGRWLLDALKRRKEEIADIKAMNGGRL